MSTEKPEPIWVIRAALESAHRDQLIEHGGEQGLRERGALLDAALGRPKNKFHYEPNADLADLAAAYAFAIAKTSHPFNDGNKRAGFLAAGIFLDANGYVANVTDEAIVETMLAVAAGEMSEPDLAGWFRGGMEPLP